MKHDRENENHEDHGGSDFDDGDFHSGATPLQLFQYHEMPFPDQPK